MFRKYKRFSKIKIIYSGGLIIFLLLNASLYSYIDNLYQLENTALLEFYSKTVIMLLIKYNIYDNSHSQFNIHDFKILIDNILPDYLNYKIVVKNKLVALSKDYKCKFLFQKHLKLHGNDCNIFLNINKISLIKSFFQILNWISVLFALLITWVGYLFSSSKNKIIEQLQLKITNQETYISELILYKKIQQEIGNLFFKKAVSNYQFIKKVDNINDNIITLSLFDPLNTEIYGEEIIKLLNAYYIEYTFNKIVKIQNHASKVLINCAKEVFYQIIISLISSFIKHRNHIGKRDQTFISIIISKKSIKFLIKGVKLTEKSVSQNIECYDIFILNYDRILQSLRKHLLEFSINYEKNTNIFEIYFNQDLSLVKPQPIKAAANIKN